MIDDQNCDAGSAVILYDSLMALVQIFTCESHVSPPPVAPSISSMPVSPAASASSMPLVKATCDDVICWCCQLP